MIVWSNTQFHPLAQQLHTPHKGDAMKRYLTGDRDIDTSTKGMNMPYAGEYMGYRSVGSLDTVLVGKVSRKEMSRRRAHNKQAKKSRKRNR